MSAGLEVGTGFQEGGPVEAQVCVNVTSQLMQPLLWSTLTATLQPRSAQTRSGQLQSPQLVLHTAAEGVNQQRADVAGPAQDRRALAAPQGPGPHQLLQKQRRQFLSLKAGSKGALPLTAPIDGKAATS